MTYWKGNLGALVSKRIWYKITSRNEWFLLLSSKKVKLFQVMFLVGDGFYASRLRNGVSSEHDYETGVPSTAGA